MKLARLGVAALGGVVILLLLAGCDAKGSRDFKDVTRYPGSLILSYDYAQTSTCYTDRAGTGTAQWNVYQNYYGTDETSYEAIVNHYISVLGQEGFTYRGQGCDMCAHQFVKGPLRCPGVSNQQDDFYDQEFLVWPGEPWATSPDWVNFLILVEFRTASGVDPLVPPP